MWNSKIIKLQETFQYCCKCVCVCGEYGVGRFRDSMKQEWGLEDLNEDEIPLNEKAQQYVPK